MVDRQLPINHLELDERLAAVLASEHPHEGGRRILEPVGHVLAVAQLPLGEPAAEPAQALGETVGVIVDEEALQAGPEDDQKAEVAWRELRLGEVVLGDLAADRHAGAEREPAEDRLRDPAADVVEVDVDTVRARLLERGVHVVNLVVDPDVVAVELLQVRDLLRRPGQTDHGAAAGDPRQLADDLTDAAGRPRDDDGVSRLRLADVEEAEVGGEAGRAEDVQRRLRRCEARVELAQHAATGDRIVLPAELADDGVAGREARVVARRHFTDDLAGHRLTELGRLRVGAGGAHPPAHVRVDREPLRLDEHLAGPGLGNRRLDELEVRVLRKALGASCKHDLPVHADDPLTFRTLFRRT